MHDAHEFVLHELSYTFLGSHKLDWNDEVDYFVMMIQQQHIMKASGLLGFNYNGELFITKMRLHRELNGTCVWTAFLPILDLKSQDWCHACGNFTC